MSTKTNNILYWVTTILFAGFMMFTAVPALLKEPESMKMMTQTLGYPEYFVTFISIAKLAGGIVLLIPGLNKIKEWAYAGMFFDLIGAIYSIYAVNVLDAGVVMIFLVLLIGIASYYFWNKKKTAA
jgi:uncharacterized membrane protein YphA (DoxX/SURF4 family)